VLVDLCVDINTHWHVQLLLSLQELRQCWPSVVNADYVAGVHRIMVPSEYVGAIIGRKGQTIRNITTRCKARYR